MSNEERASVKEMQALVYEAPRTMSLRKLPVPEPERNEVIVQVHYSGICGSELSGFLGESSIRRPPLVFGHEVSGIIAYNGEDTVNTPGLRPGDRVTVNPLISCGSCIYCLRGRPQLCERRLLLGASLPGSNAGYVAVPATAVLPVPDDLSLRSAAMIEPLAFAMRAVELSGAVAGSSALVIGAGAIGLFVIQVLRGSGVARIFVSERNLDRLAMAVALGATAASDAFGSVSDWVREHNEGRGVDTAIDAVGSEQTRRSCLASVAAGGTLVLAGLHTDETRLPLNAVVRSEIAIVGAFAYSPAHFNTALSWMAEGRAGLQHGVVVAPLSDGQLWFERLVGGDPSSKVLLEPRDVGE